MTERPVRIVYTRTEIDGLHHQAPSRARCWAQVVGRRAGPAHRLRASTATSTPAPTPPGDRPSPTACRSTRTGPYACPTSLARDPRDLHQRHAGRRLPRLRRAAGRHRARGADGRAGRAARHRPLEFRRRNALRAGDTTATGQVLDALAPACRNASRRCGRLGRGARHAVAALQRGAAARRRRGVGIACMWYGIGNTVDVEPLDACGSRCDRDGTLTLLQRRGRYRPGLQHDHGCRSPPMRSACRPHAVPPGGRRHRPDGRRRQDLGLAPDLRLRQCRAAGRPRTCAARSCALANAGAGRDARARRRHASRSRDGDGVARSTWRRSPTSGTASCSRARARFDPPTTPLDADGQGIPYATYGFAAQIAEVEVDIELGTVKVLRIVAAHDVGRAINPTLVEGQIHGGIAQGLGLALMEEYHPRPHREPARLPDPDRRRRARRSSPS